MPPTQKKPVPANENVSCLVPDVEVDITTRNVTYQGATIRYVGDAFLEFDSRQGRTVLPWGSISGITFRP